MQLNCQSLNNKKCEISKILFDFKVDFAALSETWITYHAPRFKGYHSYWKNRSSVGGGIGILVRVGLSHTEIQLVPFPDGVLEIQALKIYLKNGKNISLVNLYNPNESLTHREIEHYLDQLGDTYIMTGDFNAHSPVLDDAIFRADVSGRAVENALLKNDACLINPPNFYTRVQYTANGIIQSCLDLTLTSNDIAFKTSVDHCPGYETPSDHLPIKITIELAPAVEIKSFRKKWKTSPESLSHFKQNFPPTNLILPTSVDHLTSDLASRITEQASLTLELTSGNSRIGKTTPWWDGDCAAAIKERRKALKILKNSPTPHNLDSYKEKVKKFKDIIKTKKKNSFHSFINELTPDIPIGTAHQRIRALKGYKTAPDTPFLVDNKTILSDEGKAEALAEYYKNNSTTFQHKTLPDFEEKFSNFTNDTSFVNYNSPITFSELKFAIAKVKNTAPGEDNITYELIKNLPMHILHEFLYLINLSFQTGVFPTQWKKGLVLPIFKPNKPKGVPSSYRPITLLSCLGKIYERILNSRLQFIIEEKRLLSPSQSGFRKKQGTMDTLLQIEQEIRVSLNKKLCSVFVYIDLQSAFDSIWGRGLIYKLMTLGIRGNLLKILNSFFENRENKVLFNNSFSTPFNIAAGTPQGSVLSPTLFNLMLQDIPQDSLIQSFIYADDITFCSSNKNPMQAAVDLQRYLDSFIAWTKEWGLRVNPDKCVIQHFTRKITPIPYLSLDNNPIIYKSAHRVLGMILDSPKLTWTPHLQYLVNDCQRRLGLLRIISSPVWGASLKILRQTYISYIRSKIAYGCILYDSSRSPLLKKLEIVQNHAMRLMIGARKTSPILSLQVEAFIPPLTLHRGFLIVKNYIKLISKPNSFLTKSKLALDTYIPEAPKIANNFSCRVRYWLHTFDLNPIQPYQINLLSPIPPWENIDELITTYYDYKGTIKNNNLFNAYLRNKFPNYEPIFTDGSKIKSPVSTACAIFVPSRPSAYSWKLDPVHSVLSSELFAIYQALELSSYDMEIDHIILSDSKTALLLIRKLEPESHHDIVYSIQRQLLFLNSVKNVVIHWVKGHAGITGNEKADQAANFGHSLDQLTYLSIPDTIFLSFLKENFYKYWEHYWNTSVENTNKGKFLRNIRQGSIKKNDIIFNVLSRREQVLIQRLRIGHAGVQAYLERFNIVQEGLCPHCGRAPETLEHFFFFCDTFDLDRHILERKLNQNNITSFSLRTLLAGDPNENNFLIIKAVISYLEDCGKNLTM